MDGVDFAEAVHFVSTESFVYEHYDASLLTYRTTYGYRSSQGKMCLRVGIRDIGLGPLIRHIDATTPGWGGGEYDVGYVVVRWYVPG